MFIGGWYLQLQATPMFARLSQADIKLDQSITLLFAGDIMLDRGVAWQIQRHSNDWLFPFRKIAPLIQSADIAFANLESQISNKGQNVGSMYSFRANPEALQGLSFAGFDILSVANNHSLDWTMNALRDSMTRLKDSGITPIGAGETRTEAYNPTIVEIKGAKIGFLAYTAHGSPAWQAEESSPGVAWLDTTNLQDIIQQIAIAKKQADILVVSVHFGEEYQTQPSETQKLIAQSAIDAGADIVIGHHPHVVQPIEKYKQGWIVYSLGNFVFDQGFSKETMQGALLKVVITNTKVASATLVPITLSSEFQPAVTTESM